MFPGIILVAILLLSPSHNISVARLVPQESLKLKESGHSKKSLTATEANGKCGTMIVLESLEELSLKTTSQSTVASNSRPTDLGGGIDGMQHLLPKLYNSTRFVIHWTNGTDGGLPEDAPVPKADENGNGIPDYVENFAEIFEYTWDFLVDVRGFPVPPSDEAEPNDVNQRNPDGRYDVFIYSFQYWGYADPEQWPNSPSYSYIGVINSFGTIQLRQIVAAHEFFHAIQFYYDCAEESWWMETTATFIEDEVYPDVNNNYDYLPFWFQMSDTYGLESTERLHEYGTFIFAKRLSEDFGDDTIKEIWEEMAVTDGLVAINNTLISRNSSLVNEFSKFTTANFFLEQMYVDGADYRAAITGKTTFNGVWIEYQYNASTASDYTEINRTNVNFDAWMDRWAADYITLKLDSAKPKYEISFDGLDLTTNYLVKLVTQKSGVINETLFHLNEQKDGSLNLEYDTFDNITLIIANAGNTDTTNPSWKVIIRIIPEPPPPIYDVAIIELNLSTTFAFTGEMVNILVTVKNNGTVRKENFTVSAYWGQFLIKTKSVIDLPPATIQTLDITWSIPPELSGHEMMWANATTVPEETNLANNRFENGMLKIAVGIHDIAINGVTASKTVVGQGHSVGISVSIVNQGNHTEAFNVTVSANTTSIGSENVTLVSQSSTTLNFSWNTTSFALGNYTISANASIVLGEINTTDNTFFDGIITIRALVHDVALFDITPSKSVVGQGYSMFVKVDVENQGETTETFSVILFANTTLIEAREVTLISGGSKTLEFNWNTSSFAKANYTISAYAWPVLGETDIADNNLTDGWVIVAMVGDITGPDAYPDGKVDIRDIATVAKLFGIDRWHPMWDPNCDITGSIVGLPDGKIDMRDIALVAIQFGETDP